MNNLDTTQSHSLGVILTKLKAATHDEIRAALREQRHMSQDELLGNILVARNAISRDQLLSALELQSRLRSRRKHICALAAAELAQQAATNVIELTRAVRSTSDEVRRTTSGTHPAIGTPEADTLLAAQIDVDRNR